MLPIEASPKKRILCRTLCSEWPVCLQLSALVTFIHRIYDTINERMSLNGFEADSL